MSSPYGQGNWYAATAGEAPERPPLDGDVRVDVCVVGAGFTGLGAARALAARASVLVLEAGRVGCAARESWNKSPRANLCRHFGT